MEQEKNNTFSWVLRFATQCKGKMAASVLLAVLGSVCGIVPYFAVSQIVIQICGQNYDLIPIGFWALAALLGYLGSTWFGTVSTILSPVSYTHLCLMEYHLLISLMTTQVLLLCLELVPQFSF